MASNTGPHHEGNPSAYIFKGDNDKVTIPPKDLSIVWGGDRRYWNIPKDMATPVELYQVCWLEVTGCVDQISPDKNYEVMFNVSLTPDAFGWADYPIYLMVKRGKEGKFAWKKITLNTKEIEFRLKIATGNVMMDEKKAQESNDRKLYFGLYEVWSGKWKGGLKIVDTTVTVLP